MFSVFSWGKTGCVFKDLTEIPGIFVAYRLADVTDFFRWGLQAFLLLYPFVFP